MYPNLDPNCRRADDPRSLSLIKFELSAGPSRDGRALMRGSVVSLVTPPLRADLAERNGAACTAPFFFPERLPTSPSLPTNEHPAFPYNPEATPWNEANGIAWSERTSRDLT